MVWSQQRTGVQRMDDGKARPRVWVAQRLFADVLAPLDAHFDVVMEQAGHAPTQERLRQRLAEADAAIVNFTDRIGPAEIAAAPRLRFVATLSVGYDNLDVGALRAAGIGASNTGGSLDDSVADFTWALMLAAARKLVAGERWLRDGRWERPHGFMEWLGGDVSGRTLGILGMGRIGQAVARRASGFRMPVLYHNRSRLAEALEHACGARSVDLVTLLRESDVLVILVPRTPQTRHIIGAQELALMKPDAVLVNVARGGVLDETALVTALRGHRIAAAALDVFEGEPKVNPALLECENLVLSPHIASATTGARRKMAAMAVDNLLAFFGHGPHAGRPPNLLDPEILTRRR